MKKEFINPTIEVIELEAQEICAGSETSTPGGIGGIDDAPIIDGGELDD